MMFEHTRHFTQHPNGHECKSQQTECLSFFIYLFCHFHRLLAAAGSEPLNLGLKVYCSTKCVAVTSLIFSSIILLFCQVLAAAEFEPTNLGL
jgi:hypothetical protein